MFLRNCSEANSSAKPEVEPSCSHLEASTYELPVMRQAIAVLADKYFLHPSCLVV